MSATNTDPEIENVEELFTLAEHEARLALEVEAATAPLAARLGEAETTIVQLVEQLKTHDEAARVARVAEAFDTYKDSRKLTADDRETMALILSQKPELFERRYPRLDANKRYLLRDIAREDTSRLPADGRFKKVPGLVELTAAEQRKNPNLSYDDCFSLALSEQAKLLGGAQ